MGWMDMDQLGALIEPNEGEDGRLAKDERNGIQ
jgi:hypothetical protein